MSTARVAAIGLTSWDRIIVTDFYPDAGSYAIVRQTLEQSGGTTANTAHALSLLGIPVTMAAMVGDDPQGVRLRQDLADAGCDVRYVGTRTGEPSDTGVIVVSGRAGDTDRTIFWQQGARLRMGDALPIDDLFAHDLVILDVDDPRLRRFVVDLPMHVSPRTRILGTLTYLAELPPVDAFEIALRYNDLVGNERELRYVTQMKTTDTALECLRARMMTADTRFAAISLGARGCVILTLDEMHHVPGFAVDVVDTTGAGDAFAAGVALGILNRRSPREIGTLGNAMGALSIRALGARAGLPTRAELIAFLGADADLITAKP
jgi:sugar/nucleoside kinase (ribokinase family)